MALRSKQTLSVLRNIVRELRLANPKAQPVSKSSAIQHLLTEYRCHQVTEKRVCRSEDELTFMAKTYLCYLQSLRKHQALVNQYYSRGERSVQETADIMGFGLPGKDLGDKTP